MAKNASFSEGNVKGLEPQLFQKLEGKKDQMMGGNWGRVSIVDLFGVQFIVFRFLGGVTGTTKLITSHAVWFEYNLTSLTRILSLNRSISNRGTSSFTHFPIKKIHSSLNLKTSRVHVEIPCLGCIMFTP